MVNWVGPGAVVVVKATAVEVAVRVEVGIFKNDEQNGVAFWILSKVTIRLTSTQISGFRCSSSGLAHARGARIQKFSKLPSFMVVKLKININKLVNKARKEDIACWRAPTFLQEGRNRREFEEV